MADAVFLGQVEAVAEVQTVTVTAVDATPSNNTFTITVGAGNRTVAFSTAGDTDTSTTAAALAALWTASSHPYTTNITATESSSVITFTATGDMVGAPFTIASSVSGAGSGTIGSATTVTAATGPYHYDDAGNWSSGAVPAATNRVYCTKYGARILYGLDDSSTALAEFVHGNDCMIGLREDRYSSNANGSASETVPEYRDTYLYIDADIVQIGVHEGPGNATPSDRINIRNASTASGTVTYVNRSRDPGNGNDTGNGKLPACLLRAGSANVDVFVRQAQGGVGIGVVNGETVTVGNIRVDDESNATEVYIGAGCTFTTFRQHGGINSVRAAANPTTLTLKGGTLVTDGAWRPTNVNIFQGTWTANNRSSASPHIAATITQNGGKVDLHKSSKSGTVTTWNFNEGEMTIDRDVHTITSLVLAGRISLTAEK